MGEIWSMNACEVDELVPSPTRSVGARSSDVSEASDESMWAATSEDTAVREIRGSIGTDSFYELVSLRSLHERLALEATRAAFWEILAKRALAGRGHVPGHGGEERAVDTLTVVEGDNVLNTSKTGITLEEMVRQMQDLGSSLDALKERASEDQHALVALREEMKRTDRLKRGYKRQVVELKALLEARDRSMAPQVSCSRDDVVPLQRKLAEMRVQIEGLKRERDAARARADVSQGQHDELKERYSRREYALVSAQKRCRDLEEALVRARQEDGADQPSREALDATEKDDSPPTPRTYADASTCTVALPNDECASGTDRGGDPMEDSDGISDTTGTSEATADSPPEQESIVDAPENNVDEECLVSTGAQNTTLPAAYISTTSSAYCRIFGEDTDLDAAAHVLISADNALAQCASKIIHLKSQLQTARDESHEFKAQCAEQYNRVHKYKTLCTSLATKVKTLETHVTSVKHSANEYQRQMELLVQRQRAAAAEESHKLEGEVQALSQEQARLLLKLHAVQLDLDKSRALSAEMARRCEALEGRSRTPGGITGGGTGGMPAGSQQQVRQLESIARGLQSLAGDMRT